MDREREAHTFAQMLRVPIQDARQCLDIAHHAADQSLEALMRVLGTVRPDMGHCAAFAALSIVLVEAYKALVIVTDETTADTVIRVCLEKESFK